MATLSLKPTNRYAPVDWFASNDHISTNAERQRVATHQIRQEARELVYRECDEIICFTIELYLTKL